MEQRIKTYENWRGERRWRFGTRHLADPQNQENPTQTERLPFFQDEATWESFTLNASIREAQEKTPDFARRMAQLIRNHVPLYYDPTYTKYLPLDEQFWTYGPAELKCKSRELDPQSWILMVSSIFPLPERDPSNIDYRLEIQLPQVDRIFFIRDVRPIIRFLLPIDVNHGIKIGDRIKNNNPEDPKTLLTETARYTRGDREWGECGPYVWERSATMEDLNTFGRILDFIEGQNTEFHTDRYAPPFVSDKLLRQILV